MIEWETGQNLRLECWLLVFLHSMAVSKAKTDVVTVVCDGPNVPVKKCVELAR